MLIFLDCCSLNRPFDSPFQERVRLEGDAVLQVLALVESRRFRLVWSESLELELKRNPDSQKRGWLHDMARLAALRLTLSDSIVEAARDFAPFGLRGFDALHLASAIESGAERLLSVDDRFLQRASKAVDGGRLAVQNPVEFMKNFGVLR